MATGGCFGDNFGMRRIEVKQLEYDLTPVVMTATVRGETGSLVSRYMWGIADAVLEHGGSLVGEVQLPQWVAGRTSRSVQRS